MLPYRPGHFPWTARPRPINEEAVVDPHAGIALNAAAGRGARLCVGVPNVDLPHRLAFNEQSGGSASDPKADAR